jgi:hypothetical protein
VTSASIGDEARDSQDALRDQSSPYWRGPQSEAIQARYRELIEVAEVGYAPTPGTPKELGDAILGILRDVPDDGREDLVRGFDEALPDAVQRAVFAEISRRDATSVPPASAADVQRFATTPEGAALAREWNNAAPQKLAMLRARIGRFLAAVPAEDQAQARHFVNAMQPAEFLAVARHLTGDRR